MPAGAAQDLFGNPNKESGFNWLYSDVPPSITISSTDISGGVALKSHVSLLSSTEELASFGSNDISGTELVLTGFKENLHPPHSYSCVAITQNPGTYTVVVPPQSVRDLEGNTNTNAAELTWFYEGAPPKCVSFQSDDISFIDVDGTKTNIVYSQVDISIIVKFSETIKTLEPSSFDASGAEIVSVWLRTQTILVFVRSNLIEILQRIKWSLYLLLMNILASTVEAARRMYLLIGYMIHGRM